MQINEMLTRVNAGEVVIIDTTLRDEGAKYDNFDSFFNWFEQGEEKIVDHLGREWINKNHIPKELFKGNLTVQHDQKADVLWVFDASRRQ